MFTVAAPPPENAGLARTVTVTVSLGSSALSSITVTGTSTVVWPAANVTVPGRPW